MKTGFDLKKAMTMVFSLMDLNPSHTGLWVVMMHYFKGTLIDTQVPIHFVNIVIKDNVTEM